MTALSGASEIRLLEPEPGQALLYMFYPDYAVPMAVAGEGILRLVHQALNLAMKPGGLALFEEPEAHLHPGAVELSTRVIWTAVRNGVQVVLSTHSLELIDSLVAEATGDEELKLLSVYRLNLRAGQLISTRIAGPDVAFLRDTIRQDFR